MHDAGLDDGLREHAIDGFGKALQTVDDGDQDVRQAAVLQLVHHPQPELGALALLDPDAENLLGTVRQDSERDIDRLVAHEALVADLHPDGVEEDQRIAGVERPVLPFGHLLQNRIGHRRDQVRRDVDAVEFFQMAADLAHRHAAGVQGDDLIVEIGEAPLVFGDQLGIERARPIARNGQGHFRSSRQNRFAGIAVAVIATAFGALRIQMLVQLRI